MPDRQKAAPAIVPVPAQPKSSPQVKQPTSEPKPVHGGWPVQPATPKPHSNPK